MGASIPASFRKLSKAAVLERVVNSIEWPKSCNTGRIAFAIPPPAPVIKILLMNLVAYTW